jgi:hypothetical protein
MPKKSDRRRRTKWMYAAVISVSVVRDARLAIETLLGSRRRGQTLAGSIRGEFDGGLGALRVLFQLAKVPRLCLEAACQTK